MRKLLCTNEDDSENRVRKSRKALEDYKNLHDEVSHSSNSDGLNDQLLCDDDLNNREGFDQ